MSLTLDISLLSVTEILTTDPADYDFKGTRAISIIAPVDPEIPYELKDDSKQGTDEDILPDSPTKSSEVQGRTDVPVEELQRTFRRAMWPSLILATIVVVVCMLHDFNVMVTSACTSHTDRAFANVLLTLRILSYVLPVLDSLFDCACLRRL